MSNAICANNANINSQTEPQKTAFSSSQKHTRTRDRHGEFEHHGHIFWRFYRTFVLFMTKNNLKTILFAKDTARKRNEIRALCALISSLPRFATIRPPREGVGLINGNPARAGCCVLRLVRLPRKRIVPARAPHLQNPT